VRQTLIDDIALHPCCSLIGAPRKQYLQLGLANQYLCRRDIALFDVSTLTNLMRVLFHELMTHIPYKVVLLKVKDRL